MKKFLILFMIAAVITGITACNPKTPGVTLPEVPEDITAEEQAILDSYAGAFGHVRFLGDIDHVLKGEKVDDEEGVTVQSMRAGAIAFNETRTELTIPLTLAGYDYDGHRNPDDPEPQKYTRIATGTLTLILKGAVNAEGTGFVANAYSVKDMDIDLSVDDSVYIWLDLPERTLLAEQLDGIFTTSGGVAKANLIVNLADGKPSGIADVNTPKFGTPIGDVIFGGMKAVL